MTFRFLVLVLTFALFPLASTHADIGGGSSNWAPGKSVDPDYANAVKAVEAKQWNKAIELLTPLAARDGKNADVFNLLGYSERQRGNLDAAFKHYDRALALDPKHRGAHEYVGEAYLTAGNVAKAEEHLAVLDKLCTFSCEEYRDLKKKISEHKQKK